MKNRTSATSVRFMGSLMVWAAMLLVGSSAWAADLWPGTGSWTNATIWWSLYRVPVSTDNAFIANAYTVRVDSPAPNVNNIYFVQTTPCGTVEVNAGGSLEVLGNIYVQNSANITTLNVQGGSLTVDGYLAVYNLSLTSGILDMTDGALTAYGTFTFSDGTLKNPTTIAIGGTSPGNLIQSGGMLERSSSSGTTSLGAYTLNGNSVVVVSNGTLSVAGGISNLVATGQSVLRVEGGTLNLNSKSATVGQLAFRSGTISSVGATGFTLNGTNDALVLRNTTNAFNINLTGSSGGNIVFENDNNGTGIMSGNVDLGGLTRTINVGDGSAVEDLRISGAIANGGLTKSGAGTLTLSGINTYSGSTWVSAGTLLGGTGGSCVNTSVLVADGATNGVMILTYGGQWSCPGLTYTGSSAGLVFDLASFPPSTGYAPLQINGDMNVTGTVAVVVRNGYWQSTGTYPLVSYTGTLNSPGSFNLVGLPANVSATLVNNTGAKRLDLSVTAVPTYAQPLSVWTNLVSGSAGGTWGISANWSNGVANATDAIADFSTLDIAATSIVTNDAPRTVGTLRFGDTTASHDWIVTNSTLSLATSIGLPFVTVSNRTATMHTALIGNQGLIKNGAGKLTLTAVNTYIGGTTIDAGTLELNSASSSDAGVRGTVTVNAEGFFLVNSTVAFVGLGNLDTPANPRVSTLNIVGGAVSNAMNNCAIVDAAVNMTGGTLSGKLINWRNTTLNSLGSAATASVSAPLYIRTDYAPGVPLTFGIADGSAADDMTVSSVISALGAGSVIKNGAGLLKLTAVNTYSGVTLVSNGVLRVDGTLAAGGGEVQVSDGATLTGTGTVARVITVASNAVLTAGNPAIMNRVGTLTATASTTLAAGATYTVRIGPDGCDLLNATGGLTLTEGAELSVSMDPTLDRVLPGYGVTVATGSITGRFKQSVVNLPNQPTLNVIYTGNSIRLINSGGTLIRFY